MITKERKSQCLQMGLQQFVDHPITLYFSFFQSDTYLKGYDPPNIRKITKIFLLNSFEQTKVSERKIVLSIEIKDLQVGSTKSEKQGDVGESKFFHVNTS